MSAAGLVETLAAHGRQVDVDTIRDELAGLQGLSEEDAEATLLRCYGLTPAGRPDHDFTPDSNGRVVLGQILRQAKPAVLYSVIAASLATIPAILVPLGMRFFVDRYLTAGKQAVGPYVALGMFAAAALTTVLVILQYSVLQRSYIRLSAVGQSGFAWHVLRMRVDDLAAQSPGQIIARMNAAQRLALHGGMLLPLKAVSLVSTVVYFVALAALSLTMFAATAVVVVGIVTASLLVLRSRAQVQRRNDEATSVLTGSLSQTVQAMESVKAAAWEQFAFSRGAVLRTRMAAALSQMSLANQWLVFIPAVGLAVGLGLVLAIGTWQVINGTLSLGTLVSSQAFVAMLLESVGVLVYAGVLTQAMSSAADQRDQVLAQTLDPEALDPLHPAPVTDLVGNVRLCAVSFGYDRSQPALVEDLVLDIPAGQRVALVGPSGSGKTTIARLVTGELRPWSGHVEFDGVPRLRLPRRVRSQGIAYVPQHPVLFNGTIRDNLTLWDEDIDDDAVRAAAKDACIEQTILGRPGGYYAMVGTDGGFSGGERQRLAIARALVTDPRVLILDEATSALDPVVEFDVERNLRQRGCTCLVVAHRLSTVRDADEILVIDAGRVVQRGRFENLVHEGPFAELLHG